MAATPFVLGAIDMRDAFAITPSDTVNFTQGLARGIYIGGSGNVSLVTANGNAVTFTGLVVGTVLSKGSAWPAPSRSPTVR
jgi:hypothetical protein